MNELYMKSVIKDREKEVDKFIEYNQINRYYRDEARNQLGSTWQWKKILISWFLLVAKLFKNIFAFTSKDGIKVQG